MPIAELNLPGMQSSGRKFIAPSLRVGMTIYPLVEQLYDRAFTPGPITNPFTKPRSTNARKMDWTTDSEAGIVALSWQKQLGQAAGKWMVQVREKPGAANALDLDELQDNDWMDLYALRNGLKMPICRGVIDSIRRSTKAAGGATVRVWTLAGRDHGAFFEYPITWQSLHVQTLGELTQGLATQRVKGEIGGSPDKMFKLLIHATFASGKVSGQWELPPSLARAGSKQILDDLLEKIAISGTRGDDSLRGAYFNEPKLWTSGQKTLHQTLSDWCNPLLNEWIYDLIPPHGQVGSNGLSAYVIGAANNFWETSPISGSDDSFGTISAVIRERPFFSTIEGMDSLWPSLPAWTVPTWLQDDDDIGRGGQERHNLFELLADFGSGATMEQVVQAKPVWHHRDIAKRGLRARSESTPYLAKFKTGPGDWWKERITWQELMVDWFGPSPHLLQGTKTYKTLLPEIRIGNKLICDTGDPRRNEQYYVEGVSMDWSWRNSPSAPPEGSTTFTLTHGFKGTDADYYAAIAENHKYWVEVFA